jgi:hypothetical protein
LVIGFGLIEQIFEVTVCRLKGNKLFFLMIQYWSKVAGVYNKVLEGFQGHRLTANYNPYASNNGQYKKSPANFIMQPYQRKG